MIRSSDRGPPRRGPRRLAVAARQRLHAPACRLADLGLVGNARAREAQQAAQGSTARTGRGRVGVPPLRTAAAPRSLRLSDAPRDCLLPAATASTADMDTVSRGSLVSPRKPTAAGQERLRRSFEPRAQRRKSPAKAKARQRPTWFPCDMGANERHANRQPRADDTATRGGHVDPQEATRGMAGAAGCCNVRRLAHA